MLTPSKKSIIQVPFCWLKVLLPPVVPGMVRNLGLCGCSHSSLFFCLRHLLGDIDIAKSEGKLPTFLICFLRAMTPLQREGHFTPPESENRFENVTLVQDFFRGAFSLTCKFVKNLVISLEVSSAILTCQTSPAGSMVFMSLLQVPSEKLNSPPCFLTIL